LKTKPKIFLTIPLMDELENIPALLNCLKLQTYRRVEVIICVNQPDSWWNIPAKIQICKANVSSLQLLQKEAANNVQVIDRCSPGNGWQGRHFGVGWARKVAMDAASGQAGNNDMILMMDGDTVYKQDYVSAVAQAFVENPDAKALAAPYFHKLTAKAAEDRAMLRYEIYMRYFSLNMLRINNPYAFTAIGSAIACTVASYRAIRGITPHKSGEDFYFVQKLRKYGPVIIQMDEMAYPAARFSDRVFFGTGPAMIKGHGGDWSAYPVYPSKIFDEIKQSFDSFQNNFEADTPIPMSEFLFDKFGEGLWDDLRKNAKTRQNFVRACWHKVDGLRILQYLKWRYQQMQTMDSTALADFLEQFFPAHPFALKINCGDFDIENAPIDLLGEIRNFLFEKETLWRKQINILR